MSTIKTELLALRRGLDRIEAGIGSEPVSTAALEDFKVAVDDVRASVLSMLVADDSKDYGSFIRKYRLRRTAQVCHGVLSGFADRTLDCQTPGIDRLQSAVDETLAFLDKGSRIQGV